MNDAEQRRLVAIVVADVVGYSRLMGANETATLTALRTHRSELIDPLVARHHGRIVKTMGDGLLLEFTSVVDAARYALDLQLGMIARNAGCPGGKAIRFRVGIHLGDVVVDGDDILGDGVNVAARIEALAEPDGIAISDDAYRQVRDRLPVAWRDGGEHRVKNIARAIPIWRWEAGGEPSASAAEDANGAQSPDGPSIAVLPFDNMSGDLEQEYFADGITEDIITEISKIPGLLVISRNSTFTYKGKAAKAQDVCRELGVRCMLEGSVRKAGGRVRITAQLIDGKSGGHLWAERYDRDLTDIFAVQDDVTAQIVRALRSNLGAHASGPTVRAETEKPEAYDCVLRGREQYRLFTPDGNRRARQLYERATEIDPDYAQAYAGLAHTWLHEWFLGESDALDRACDLALKAESLDPSQPLVQEALGSIQLFRRQHDAALAAARRWLAIEPGNADAHANLAGILQFSGEPEQVFALIDRAMALNPFYPFYYILYAGQALFSLERYAEARIRLARSVARNPESFPARVFLAACIGHIGDAGAARTALDEAERISPDFSIAWLETIMPYRHAADMARLIDGLRKAGLDD